MRRLDQFQQEHDISLYVGPGNTIKQTFSASHENLAGIRFPIFNPQLGGSKQYEIKVLNRQGEIIRSEIVTESNLEWGRAFRYDFEPITDAKDKTFSLVIHFPAENSEDEIIVSSLNTNNLDSAKSIVIDTPDRERVSKNYITIWYAKKNLYDDGEAYLNTQKLPGDVVFQTYYQTSYLGFLHDSINDAWQRFTIDIRFSAAYFVIIFMIITALFIRTRKN